MYSYDLKTQKINPKFINTKVVDLFTRIHQIENSRFLISGGSLDDRLTTYSPKKIYEGKMIDRRGFHGLDVENKYKAYFIGGQLQNQCEVFDLRSKSSQSLKDFPIDICFNGISQNSQFLYSFGGLSQRKAVDFIYKLIKLRNEWERLQVVLPQKAGTISIKLSYLDASLIYDNDEGYLETQLFDFKFEKIVRHGNQFNYKCGLISNPIFQQGIIYQFDVMCEIYFYDLKAGHWEQAKKI